MKQKMKKTTGMILFTVLSAVNMGSNTVYAAENMTPTYEVKFLLDSNQVLNSDKMLKKDYRNLFETGSDYKTMGILYLDTEGQDFNNQGWLNRIRITEGKSEFELTYKKRYAVQNGDIDSALTLANQEGFDATDTNYSAEIDWGYSKMTLSLSCKKEKSNKGYDDLELPKKGDAIDMMKDKLPGKEEDWLYENWGKDTIKDAKKAGPAYCYRYEADNDAEASSLRTDLMNYLDGMGILKHEDSLKTQMILDAYLDN